MDPLKANFKHLLWFHGSHRAKALQGVAADPAVEFIDLLIVEAGVGLGKGHQLGGELSIPKRKGVVGEQVGAAPAARLGIDQHGIQAEGIQLVLPPMPSLAPLQVGGVQRLEHQSFGGMGPGL